MPPKLAKPDSTAKPTKLVTTSNPIKTSPSMMKTSKLVKSKVAENGHKSENQPKVKKERIDAASSSAPSSSKTVPPYDEDDSKKVKKEISSNSETDNKDKIRKPQKNHEFVKSEESDDHPIIILEDETPDENENEVETIVGRRLKGDIIQYRVKWKGYSLAETTWEPMENLLNAQDLVNEFEATRMAEAEKRAGKNSTKGNQSGTTTNDQNLVMTDVNCVVPNKHAWILQFDNTLTPASQATVMLFPAKEKAMCVEFLGNYIQEQENTLEQAKVMFQQLSK